ncbi:uncharacterized protein A1O9_00874 [Exophiala aquamarina CBS 119918]|uniref:Carotenoid oxygenase n=1 Tax=Exophiala aquamarina CBS 119918 TaxID=1182545 RepID=A0A072Q4R6_9EURO|nr:uncharacterized protein A1O9_00874 [Exophiala aquamarina CBS 119918]KEF62900.1 hypothetical protein A1O9_00874 [Exophiala aquamarina CBS 119918]
MAHVTPSTIFPKMFTVSPWNQDHTRFEGEVFSLEIEGKLPSDLHGAFFRVQPDTVFPPLFEDDIPLNGDGNVSSFYFKDGHVDFKQRYVRTPKFLAERSARKALFGRYRNKYTDDPRVRNVLTRTTANTHVIYHAGKLMAIKEDALPYEIDATTLETIGPVDYNGTLKSPTHTAHPKADPETGELIAYGYEAKGDATEDICYFIVDKHGKVSEEFWFKQPWTCMIHDFWVTKNYVIFPINGIRASLDNIKAGLDHFYYDDDLDHQLLGVIPRYGATPEDVKWFRAPEGCFSHTINSYEEDGKIILDASVWSHNLFPFFPNKEGVRFAKDPSTLRAPVYRFRFDPKADPEKTVYPEAKLIEGVNEFGRIDDRLFGKPYTRFWILSADTSRQQYQNNAATQTGLNTLVMHNFETGETQRYYHGDDTTFQEPVFVPRNPDSEPDDGYIVILVDLYKTNRCDLLLFEARNIQAGPIATMKLPLKLLDGLHGSWVGGEEYEFASGKRPAETNASNDVNGAAH